MVSFVEKMLGKCRPSGATIPFPFPLTSSSLRLLLTLEMSQAKRGFDFDSGAYTCQFSGRGSDHCMCLRVSQRTSHGVTRALRLNFKYTQSKNTPVDRLHLFSRCLIEERLSRVGSQQYLALSLRVSTLSTLTERHGCLVHLTGIKYPHRR